MERLKITSYRIYKRLEVPEPLKRSQELTDQFINNVNGLIEREL